MWILYLNMEEEDEELEATCKKDWIFVAIVNPWALLLTDLVPLESLLTLKNPKPGLKLG